MNDRDDELFEAELHRLKPARSPEEFIARLMAARPVQRVQSSARSRPIPRHSAWWWLLRWLAPATAAAAVVALLVWRSLGPETGVQRQPVTAPASPALKADDVEIDRRLVAAFDAVAQLPSGEPVRFRCREWTDEVVLRDSARGVVIEQRTPRLEVIPVSFETY
jgi:hypothetical protein